MLVRVLLPLGGATTLRALLDRLRGRRVRPPGGGWANLSADELAQIRRTPSAYAWTFVGTLEALQAQLQAVGPWEWQLRDSAWYGDYLLALGPGLGRAEGGRLRVYEDEPQPGHFTIELIWDP